jgi:hypothetical protein
MCRQILVKLSKSKNSENSFIDFVHLDKLASHSESDVPTVAATTDFSKCMWLSRATEVQTCMIFCLWTNAGPKASTNFRDTSRSFVTGERKRRMLTSQCREKKKINRKSLLSRACWNQYCTYEAAWLLKTRPGNENTYFIPGAITKGVRIAVWKHWSPAGYMHHYNVLHAPL